MELSVESFYLDPPRESGMHYHHKQAAELSHERTLEEWNDAYRRIENYFIALRVENKLLLSSMVLKILGRANDRLELEGDDRSPVELASEEIDRMLVNWFRQVLDNPESEMDDRLSARGRLALWMVHEEVPWQEYFLSGEDLPENYRIKMQTAWLHADPDFSFVEMKPRPIDLGLVKVASDTLERMADRRKVISWALWLIGISLVAMLFFLSR